MDTGRRNRTFSITFGGCLLVGGFLMTVNAWVAGPYASGLGWQAVIAQTTAGVACTMVGMVELWRALPWLARAMRLPWPPKTALAYAALALPGTFLPREAGISLCNSYCTLGWPLPVDVTIYGPSSGHSVMSVPFLPGMLCNFLLWCGTAMLSHRIWRHARAAPPTLARALSTGAVCSLWGVMLACFVAAVLKFALDCYWTWTVMPAGLGSVAIVVGVFPAICVGVLSMPFALQVLVSRHLPPWPRVVFCSVPVLLLAGLSSPFAQRLPDVGYDSLLPVVHPVTYCQGTYVYYLELLGGVERKEYLPYSLARRLRPETAAGGSASASQPSRKESGQVPPAVGDLRWFSR